MKLEPTMSIERAVEILDPNHREHYESIEPVNEAYRMGAAALQKQIPRPLYQRALTDAPECTICGNKVFRRSLDGRNPRFCGWCGQAVSWDRVETQI